MRCDLAAGERRGGAVEREIIEADVLEEAEPAADFLEHFGGDQLAGCRRVPARRRTPRRRRRPGAQTSGSDALRPIGEIARCVRGERDRAGLRIEPRAVAIGGSR